QPGGNVTGVFYRQQELAAKQLELLVEAFPERKRVAVLWDSISEDTFHAAEHAASSMSLSLDSFKLDNSPYDFEAAFRNMSQGCKSSVAHAACGRACTLGSRKYYRKHQDR